MDSIIANLVLIILYIIFFAGFVSSILELNSLRKLMLNFSKYGSSVLPRSVTEGLIINPVVLFKVKLYIWKRRYKFEESDHTRQLASAFYLQSLISISCLLLLFFSLFVIFIIGWLANG